MGGYYKLLLFGQSPPNGHVMVLFPNTGPQWAGISNATSPCTFRPISATFDEGMFLTWENTGFYFSWQSDKLFEKNCGILKF